MGMAMGFGMETGRQGRIVMEGTREEIANNEKVQSTYLGIKVS
jgi:ABC-type branched-subunit amino acid transport system ATPase component